MKIQKAVVEESIEIQEDLEIYQPTTFVQTIKCRNIISVGGKWNIDAWDINAGNIDAWDINAGNIDAGNINAWNINAGNIDAGNINAWDIDAGNINAWDIICEKRTKKSEKVKTIARIFIQNRSQSIRNEKMPCE